MRKIALAALMVIVMSASTFAQTGAVPLSPQVPLESSGLQRDAVRLRQGVHSPARRVHHCCNLKGALIGAGIGAAIGAFYAQLCDAGDCALTHIKYMGIMGGIGAGLGAFVEQRHGLAPWPEPPVLVDGTRDWSFAKSRMSGWPNAPTLREFTR
jgi:hypothetical protein